MVDTLHVGGITVDRIVDIEELFFPPTHLFPAAVPPAMAALGAVFEAGEHNAAGWLRQAFAGYLVRGSGPTILVDTGVGCGKERDLQAWDHRDDDTFLRNLACVGCGPGDIDIVICTHLHADHVGWNTRLIDGAFKPTFSNARYLLARAEVEPLQEAFLSDRTIGRGSFIDSVAPLIDSRVVDLFDDGMLADDAVILSVRPGHTPGTTVVCLASEESRAFISGDVIHHEVQLVRPEWSSNFCYDAAASAGVRRGLLEEAARTGGLLLPAHFPPCRIRTDGVSFEAVAP